MSNNRKFYLYISMLIAICIFSQFIIIPQENLKNANQDDPNQILRPALTLDGLDNIIISKMQRVVDVNVYGLLQYEDTFEIMNRNSFPISGMFIAIPLGYSDILMSYKSTNQEGNTLVVKRSQRVINDDFELIEIYFETPLLPQESREIIFYQSYTNLISYSITVQGDQSVRVSSRTFPFLPYRVMNKINSSFIFPQGVALGTYNDWGDYNPALSFITFDFEKFNLDYLEPFQSNIEGNQSVFMTFSDAARTKIEINSLVRNIYISPWGLITVKEDYSIQNRGFATISQFSLGVLSEAFNIQTYDDLGTILGTTITRQEDSTLADVKFTLTSNRIRLAPGNNFDFTLQYQLSLSNFMTFNWLQQSIQLDLFLSEAFFLTKSLTNKIFIEGCYSIDYLSQNPDNIEKSQINTILTYNSEDITTINEKSIIITYTIDTFTLITRPLLFIIVILGICSLIILLIKRRAYMGTSKAFEKQILPIADIREFCSLYEEKNLLLLEINEAENDVQRKKIPKKKYRNLVNRNNNKIKVIEDEIKPFKENLIEFDETFETIIKKLDVLEAERQTVDDGLKLLEARYKKGKLPSRSAYMKLASDFEKRQRKINRTIDRFIQQLRSYLL